MCAFILKDHDASGGSINFFFLVLNHPVSDDRIRSRLIQIWGVVTMKALYPSQMVCLVGIEPENSSYKLSLCCQLSNNHLVGYIKL